MEVKDAQFLCSTEIKVAKYFVFPFVSPFTVSLLYNFPFVLAQIFHIKADLNHIFQATCSWGPFKPCMFLTNLWNLWPYSVNTNRLCLLQSAFLILWINLQSRYPIYLPFFYLHLSIHFHWFICSFSKCLLSLLYSRCYAKSWEPYIWLFTDYILSLLFTSSCRDKWVK